MENEIDDSFYNRQRYVLGDAAMKLLSSSKIYLHGLSGLGIEIAKNLVLGGVKELIISDKRSCKNDLGTNFYILTTSYRGEGTSKDVACYEKLKQLNPHVTVRVANHDFDELKKPMKTDSNKIILEELAECDCVILTECKLDTIGIVQNYCRMKHIKLIVSEVIGLLGICFCDFGAKFVSETENDEETLEFFIENVENAANPAVQVMNGESHGLNSGDLVVFYDVEGMQELNGKECIVDVVTKSNFKLNIDTSKFGAYTGNGICKSKKSSITYHFGSFYDQIVSPTIINPDFCRQENSEYLVYLYLALKKYYNRYCTYPEPNNKMDIHAIIEMFKNLCTNNYKKVTQKMENFVGKLIEVSSGQLHPLAAVFGGIAAQEAMKAVTHRFTPIKQWLVFECSLVNPTLVLEEKITRQHKNKRLKNLHVCLGNDLADKLREARVFMVGCGAIGCELLKNMALLGISGNEYETIDNPGLIQVTDNDLIEKSNLNRQFLFKENHIQLSKSEVARQSVLQMNPGLNIVANQNLMCSDTEHIYTDELLQSFDICLNALDNIEGRRYMDSRCVANVIPLLESGTMSTKGHVQVILPHFTENYSNVNDPETQKEIPYCTLKSFPAKIEHCVEWAREKFQMHFMTQPQATLNYSSIHGKHDTGLLSDDQVNYNELYAADKFFKKRPKSYKQCIELSRRKFQTYFYNKARQLLHNFPLDTKTEEGALFWQFPKRPPKAIEFDINEPLHMQFIMSYACLIAKVNNISTKADEASIKEWISNTVIPEFCPNKNQKIITDESVKRPEKEPEYVAGDEQKAHEDVVQYLNANGDMEIRPIEFDKDNTSHVELIAALSNLRARMYSIEEMDTYSIKKLSGRIIPAIATSTSVVAGLMCIELLKFYSMDKPHKLERTNANFDKVLSVFRNTFLNLSSSEIIMSEPGVVAKRKLFKNSGGYIQFSVWDKWEVREEDLISIPQKEGKKSIPNVVTLNCFIEYLKEKYDVTVTMILQKNRIVYFNIRDKALLSKSMEELLKREPEKPFAELFISYASIGGEDSNGPGLRYWFQK